MVFARFFDVSGIFQINLVPMKLLAATRIFSLNGTRSSVAAKQLETMFMRRWRRPRDLLRLSVGMTGRRVCSPPQCVDMCSASLRASSVGVISSRSCRSFSIRVSLMHSPQCGHLGAGRPANPGKKS